MTAMRTETGDAYRGLLQNNDLARNCTKDDSKPVVVNIRVLNAEEVPVGSNADFLLTSFQGLLGDQGKIIMNTHESRSRTIASQGTVVFTT